MLYRLYIDEISYLIVSLIIGKRYIPIPPSLIVMLPVLI
jgi:hypothetical protein